MQFVILSTSLLELLMKLHFTAVIMFVIYIFVYNTIA